MKWEFAERVVADPSTPSGRAYDLAETLTSMAEAGWELISVVPIKISPAQGSFFTEFCRLYFKRPSQHSSRKPNESQEASNSNVRRPEWMDEFLTAIKSRENDSGPGFVHKRSGAQVIPTASSSALVIFCGREYLGSSVELTEFTSGRWSALMHSSVVSRTVASNTVYAAVFPSYDLEAHSKGKSMLQVNLHVKCEKPYRMQEVTLIANSVIEVDWTQERK